MSVERLFPLPKRIPSELFAGITSDEWVELGAEPEFVSHLSDDAKLTLLENAAANHLFDTNCFKSGIEPDPCTPEAYWATEPVSSEERASLIARGYDEVRDADAFSILSVKTVDGVNYAQPISKKYVREYKKKFKQLPPNVFSIGEEPSVTDSLHAVSTDSVEPTMADHLVTMRSDRVKTKMILWMWPNRVPFAKLTVFAGNPDQGKSLVTMYMVCQLTTGQPMYGSTEAIEPCEVLILAGEDEANDTIVPRLQAGGADLTKIHIVESIAVRDGKGTTISERETQLDTDIHAIESMLESHPEVRLVIIDPLSNYLGRANMNREQEVRQVLIPLKNLAARQNVAIVTVMHLNKSTDGSAIHRIGGAVAFTGIARAVWLFGEDPNDTSVNKDKKMMLRVKGNIAKRVGGLTYDIQVKPVLIEGKSVPQPVVNWLGETVQTAQDVLIAGRPVGNPGAQRQSAEEWLADFLGDGSETQSDVQSRAKKAGHTWRTIERAKAKLGVISYKPDKYWEWRLPTTPLAPDPVELEPKS